MKWFRYLMSCLIMGSGVHAMVFDDRFLPLIPEPFFSIRNSRWDFGVRGVFFGANRSYHASMESSLDDVRSGFSSDMGAEETGLFRVLGRYDEIELDAALRKAQVISSSLLPADLLRTISLPWRQNGRISFQGVVFETFLHLTNYLGIGASMIGGKMDSHLQLDRFNRCFSPGDEEAIIQVNTKIHQLLKVEPPCFNKGMFGDIDAYLRLHFVRDYWHKCRRVDMGVNLGFLIPTAQKFNFRNPAFVPLGGDKHFGMYGAFDGTFVLKEDFIVGLLVRGSKRFARTDYVRMPVFTEPLNYAVLTGLARVNPGWTAVFSPRFQLTGVREGLGFNIAYFLIWHGRDSVTDQRSSEEIAQTAPANTCIIEERSSWGQDYMSISAMYDFGYEKDNGQSSPILSLTVDIPFKGLIAKQAPKTHGISLRIESRI